MSGSASLGQLLSALSRGVKCSTNLPLAEDFEYATAFPEFSCALKESKATLEEMLVASVEAAHKEKPGVVNGDLEVILEKAGVVGEEMMERVETYVETGGKLVSSKKSKRVMGDLERILKNLVKMEKPQKVYKFSSYIQSHRRIPFRPPFITQKYHSKYPLEPFVPLPGHGISLPSHVRDDVDSIICPDTHYPHPYERDVKDLISQIKESPLSFLSKSSFKSNISVSSVTYISNVEQLQTLSVLLQSQSRIAIDLEAHSYHSFSGFVCLMQISIEHSHADYLIDTLLISREDIHNALASVFSNPNILKIMHGSASDMKWLQRDFGLYIVHLFDTGVAARKMGLPRFGLDYLLKKYIGITVDKKYQLADWRERPLTQDLMDYARGDTKDLLKVYDCMTKHLTHKTMTEDTLKSIMEDSQTLTLLRYTIEPFYPDSYRKILLNHTQILAQNKVPIFKNLFDWRDRVARIQDQSLHYVCPNGTLFKICNEGTLGGVVMTPLMKTYTNQIKRILDGNTWEEDDNHQLTNIHDTHLTNPNNLDDSSAFLLQVTKDDVTSDDDSDNHITTNKVQLHPSNNHYINSSPALNFHYFNDKNPTLISSQEDEQDAILQSAIFCADKVRLAIMNGISLQPWVELDEPMPHNSQAQEDPKLFNNTQHDVNSVPKSMKEMYNVSTNMKRKRKESTPKDDPDKEAKSTKTLKKVQSQTDEAVVIDKEWMNKDIGILSSSSLTSRNPFFAGAALVAGSDSTNNDKKKKKDKMKKRDDSGGKKKQQSRGVKSISGDRTFSYK